MSDTRHIMGSRAEQTASDYLTKKGHTIIIQNFRTKNGEIDIISNHGNCIVFTEVKFRSNDHFGGGLSAVTPLKQKKLSRVAMEYIATHKLFETDARFDVISIHYEKGDMIVDHVENAFDLAFP